MKRALYLSFILLALLSCDGNSKRQGQDDQTSPGTTGGGNQTDDPIISGGSQGGGGDQYVLCDSSSSFANSPGNLVLGKFKVCQQSNFPNMYRFIFEQADVKGVCIYPMTIYNNGNSDVIGSKVCGRQEPGQPILGDFAKDRTGKNYYGIEFRYLPLEAFFVIKDTSDVKEDFEDCAFAKEDTPQRQYQKMLECTKFVQEHNGYFIQVEL